MKKILSITTTVNVTPSDVEFVPKASPDDVPTETAQEHRRRIVRECCRRFFAKEENRVKNIRRVIDNRRKKRLQQKSLVK